jgi:hypothetical protein
MSPGISLLILPIREGILEGRNGNEGRQLWLDEGSAYPLAAGTDGGSSGYSIRTALDFKLCDFLYSTVFISFGPF